MCGVFARHSSSVASGDYRSSYPFSKKSPEVTIEACEAGTPYTATAGRSHNWKYIFIFLSAANTPTVIYL